MTSVDDRPEQRATLSTTATGDPVPPARRRARSPIHGLGRQARLIGWLAPVAVMLLALLLRLYTLDDPHRLAFDETYYAKDGWSLLHEGYVSEYRDDADGNTDNEIDDDIASGHTADVFSDRPSLTVHPDVGKWMIAGGEWLFGMDPFGWRFMSAVVGSLMVLVMCRLVRRMTGSTLLGCVAGLLLMLDGLHFVLSRLALLDIFFAFWLLCGVACVVADRDWHRARIARLLDRDGVDVVRHGWGPIRPLLFRPWLLAGGVCFGLAIGTKWGAMYPLAAFGLLCWVWSAGARRSFGVRWAVLRGALVDGVPAFAQLVLVAGLVYVASWGGWLAHADQYEATYGGANGETANQYRQFTGEGKCVYPKKKDDDPYFQAENLDDSRRWPTATEPDASGLGEVWQSLRSLWAYHQDVYTFHTHFLNCSTHTYMSKPSGWLLLNRPVGVAVTNDIQPGEQGCDAPEGSDCLRQVLLIGNPTLWWGGCLALIAAVAMWVGARDWRYGVAVVGALSTWLPWLLYDDRPIFLFYAIGTLPFVVLAITLVLGSLLGPSRRPSPRRTAGVVVGGSFLVLVLINFAWFWPIWTNGLLTHSEWLDRIWFSRWI